MTSPLGLSTQSNRIEPYDTRWLELFAAEAKEVARALGPIAISIEQVGSTSVPGLPSKPILDIAVAVRDLAQYVDCIKPLASLGYEHAHWAGVERNHVFGKGVDRTHLLHVVEYEGDGWRSYLKFRNALRADVALRLEYEALKLALARAHPVRRGDYTAGKASFISRVLAVA